MFNYDIEIIKDDFKYHKSKLRIKYDLLEQLERRGDEFIRYIKDKGEFEDMIQVSMSKRASKLIPLSLHYLNTQQKLMISFWKKQKAFFSKTITIGRASKSNDNNDRQ